MLRIKVFLTLSLVVAILSSCGVSQQDKEEIATITCNIIKSSRNMDAALRIKEINSAREQMGEERFLGTDNEIIEALELGLCEALVMHDLSVAEIERGREVRARLERERIATEQRKKEEERRIAVEQRKKKEEERRIAAEQRKREAKKERKFLSNLYGDYEQLEQNRPEDFTLELISATNTGAIFIGGGQSYIVKINDEIKEWNAKIVYSSSAIKSVVLEDTRNNNLFLVTVE